MFWKRGEPKIDPKVTDAAQREAILGSTGKLKALFNTSDTGPNCWITSKPAQGEQAKADWLSQRQAAPIKSVDLKWEDAEGNKGWLHAMVNRQTKHWDIEWKNCDGTEQKKEHEKAIEIPLGEAVTVTSADVARATAKARGRGGDKD